MSAPLPPEAPRFPVAPLSLAGAALVVRGPRELAIDDVDDATLARLVRLRHALEQQQGWLLLGLIGVALGSVVAVGVSVDSRLTFGAYAGAVAAGAVGLGFVADRVAYGLFRRRALLEGLSDNATAELFRSAADAWHWMDVLRSCGHAPGDAEVAKFVRRR
jgi:hypothetical protein